ncbi:MAG: hypothetical protein JW814_09045 [Candidatus Krumholzibacteriota bacterium]|nr:hypothetical protein [Candidatus Krumholzibacteriota bacterium]
MKIITIIFAVVIAITAYAGFSNAQVTVPKLVDAGSIETIGLKKQTLCPVMGNPVDPKIFTDIQGQRVYFCCAMCIDQFRAAPGKYFEQARIDSVLFENIQTTCPISGDVIDRKFFTWYKGRGIYFCGEECKKIFDSDPEKQMGKLGKEEEKKIEKEKMKVENEQ